MPKRNSTFEDFPYDTEQLKINKNSISLRINTITGKDGSFWVCISPSIDVSGYGKSPKEAKKSFDENVETFIEDFISLSQIDRNKVLRKMGWTQKRYFKKQFSKVFVDQEGILQNLEQPKLTSLETVA